MTSMATTTFAKDHDDRRVSMAGQRFSLRIHRSMDEMEPLWRICEQRLASSVYQRFGFCRAYMNSIGEADSESFVAFELSDENNDCVLLLPLMMHSKGPWRIARFIGAKHSNFGLPLFDPARLATATGDEVEAFLRQAAALAGIDAFKLLNMPVRWADAPQPLALMRSQTSVNPAGRANLSADADETLKALRGARGMKQLRGKERKLAEQGSLVFRKAQDLQEQYSFLAAFLRQKAEWFEQRGMRDAFGDVQTLHFFENLIQENAASHGNTIDFFSLLLNGHPIALYSGARHQNRLSLFTTSIMPDETIMRASPGELLLWRIMEDACSNGVRTIDLGVGASETKRRWLPDDEALVDVIRGYGAGGAALAHVMAHTQTIKRVIKSSPALLKAAKRLRGEQG